MFNRDRGVCDECGLDCVDLRRKLKPLLDWHGAAVTLMGVVNGLGGNLPERWRKRFPEYDADGIYLRVIDIAAEIGVEFQATDDPPVEVLHSFSYQKIYLPGETVSSVRFDT